MKTIEDIKDLVDSMMLSNESLVEEIKALKIKAVNPLIVMIAKSVHNLDIKSVREYILLTCGVVDKINVAVPVNIQKPLLKVIPKNSFFKNKYGELCMNTLYNVNDIWLSSSEIENRSEEFPELCDYLNRIIIKT